MKLINAGLKYALLVSCLWVLALMYLDVPSAVARQSSSQLDLQEDGIACQLGGRSLGLLTTKIPFMHAGTTSHLLSS